MLMPSLCRPSGCGPKPATTGPLHGAQEPSGAGRQGLQGPSGPAAAAARPRFAARASVRLSFAAAAARPSLTTAAARPRFAAWSPAPQRAPESRAGPGRAAARGGAGGYGGAGNARRPARPPAAPSRHRHRPAARTRSCARHRPSTPCPGPGQAKPAAATRSYSRIGGARPLRTPAACSPDETTLPAGGTKRPVATGRLSGTELG